MTKPEITDFIKARLAEDEEQANAVDLLASSMEVIATHHLPEFAEFSVRWDPVSIRAEIEAKRRILDAVAPSANWDWDAAAGCIDEILREMAYPYAKHADYREDWKPWRIQWATS